MKTPTSILDRPPFVHPAYTYKCKVIKVVDGDTLDVVIDVGFSTNITKRLRLFLIDAWEIRGVEKEKGLAAKKRLQEIVDSATQVYVQTIMDSVGKYGRVLSWVWVETNKELSNVNETLLNEGHGTIYKSSNT